MATADLVALLPRATMNPPCSPKELGGFLKYVGAIPHPDYLAFMKAHNGCAGPAGTKSYVTIWPLEEVTRASDEAGVPNWAPGLLLFAGDGGDRSYAFDRSNPCWPIVSVSLSSMSRTEMEFIASTFSDFIRRVAADELW
jgi:hypothetical protein